MGKHASTGLRLTIAITLVLALTACAQDPTINPTPTTTTSTSSSSSTDDGELLALYFVGETPQGPMLYREFHRIPVTTSRIETALNAVLATTPPDDPDYLTLWPKDASVESISRDGSTAIIDINFSALNVGSAYEMRAIDQLVWTATAADPNVTSVRFLRSGKQVESFAGHVDTTGTFARQAQYEVLAPIWITSIENGGTLSGAFTFGGLATVFEAALLWEVSQDGRVVKKGYTTAAEAGPARAPWQVTITGLPSGTYLLRAYATSAKDGSLFAEDTKTITYTAP
jgi:hypothetical protein